MISDIDILNNRCYLGSIGFRENNLLRIPYLYTENDIARDLVDINHQILARFSFYILTRRLSLKKYTCSLLDETQSRDSYH